MTSVVAFVSLLWLGFGNKAFQVRLTQLCRLTQSKRKAFHGADRLHKLDQKTVGHGGPSCSCGTRRKEETLRGRRLRRKAQEAAASANLLHPQTFRETDQIHSQSLSYWLSDLVAQEHGRDLPKVGRYYNTSLLRVSTLGGADVHY